MVSTITDVLEAALENLKIPSQGISLVKLHGDASYRVYYRLLLPSGKSFIVMQLPAGKTSASEEITNLREKPAEIPFVNVDHFLKARGLPVPNIFFADEPSGILLLEDFGDETLEKRVAEAGEDVRRIWYRKAIDLLKSFQQKTSQPDPSCIAYRRSFDSHLLSWEFDHFLEYGIEARLGIKIPSDDAKAIRSLTERITGALTRMPQQLVHRDFQSRNLMIQEEGLKLLDFQDALMGPRPYDLAALLRDSYVPLSPALFSELIGYYSGEPSFRNELDLVTIQRKLKDAGRFVYIDQVKGNSSFLKHIPNSLRYAREAIERQASQKELFGLLKKYVPEWRDA